MSRPSNQICPRAGGLPPYSYALVVVVICLIKSAAIYGWDTGAVVEAHVCFPEIDGIIDPAFGDSASADAEAMTESIVDMKLDRDGQIVLKKRAIRYHRYYCLTS